MAANSWCTKIVDGVFRPLRLGQMVMHWPNGEIKTYGQELSGITARIDVKDWLFFRNCCLYGDVGFGEAYVAGHWDTDNITNVIRWMIHNVEHHPTLMADSVKWTPVNWFRFFNTLAHQLRDNTLTGSKRNISAHYDLGNDFFKLFLDETMAYSSGYFINGHESLYQAQINKFEGWCRKLRLKSSDHLLEIGSGWGGFALYAAKHYGCRITTITISKEQYALAKKLFKEQKVDHLIDIQLVDYRHVTGKYDKIISIEMIEAVGHKFLPVYVDAICHLLKTDGVVGLQMILSPDHRYDSFRKNVDWIQKHIFPGSLLPSMKAIHDAMFKTGNLNIFDYEDISPSYVKTLALWRERFNANKQAVLAQGFDEAFIRKWNYYLSYCEAAFDMRNIAVVQGVFTRPNNHLLK